MAAALFVAAFWWLSGAVNTAAYQLAPQRAPPHLAGRAGGAMALAFQAATCVALASAFLVGPEVLWLVLRVADQGCRG